MTGQDGELGLARAYISGDLDVDGDLADGLRRVWAAVGHKPPEGGVWPGSAPLPGPAQLGLQPGSRLLDMGCGWGSLTVHAARDHRAQVTAVTLPEIAKLRTAEQVRVWRLYLAGSALAFEEGRMGVDQILAVRKPG